MTKLIEDFDSEAELKIDSNSKIELYSGNCLDVLKQLPKESINCCITSPPYYGLRDYGTDPLIWDVQEGCEHVWGPKLKKKNAHKAGETNPGKEHYTKNVGQWSDSQGRFCQKCGAWKGSLGLEPTPSLYINHLVQIFQGVKQVLKKDGTLWVNLGDSYAASGGSGSGEYQKRHKQFGKTIKRGTAQNPRKAPDGLKPKDLIGIPWMLAFALRDDGWYLRCDIIWNKNNPMPSSVRDRPTISHEYIFLLSKSRKYYYDYEAIKEEGSGCKPAGNKIFNKGRKNGGYSTKPEKSVPDKVNKRSVWTVSTQPYKDAHFAVFPQKLIIPCIKAGCPKNGTVLDPFMGSGTVGSVCRLLNRNFVGIDLNENYLKMSKRRIYGT